jgi:hypothetical protein
MSTHLSAEPPPRLLGRTTYPQSVFYGRPPCQNASHRVAWDLAYFHGRTHCVMSGKIKIIVLTTAVLAGCRAERKVEAHPAPLAWQKLGSWSGHGNAQTDSFDIGFSQCRIRWEARNEKAPGQGLLHVTVNSAISGRELAVAVDHRGEGHELAYVGVEPHFSYLVIESSNEDWSVTVEEPALTGGGGAK